MGGDFERDWRNLPPNPSRAQNRCMLGMPPILVISQLAASKGVANLEQSLERFGVGDHGPRVPDAVGTENAVIP